jgi:hypothetical protein
MAAGAFLFYAFNVGPSFPFSACLFELNDECGPRRTIQGCPLRAHIGCGFSELAKFFVGHFSQTCDLMEWTHPGSRGKR